MNIDVLYFEGCPNHKPTVQCVRNLLGRMGIDAQVNEVEVTQENDPAALKFLGSPTVLIDSRDIDPVQRENVTYGFGCRTFGGAGVPSEEIIERAIHEARGGGVTECCSGDRQASSQRDKPGPLSIKGMWSAPASVGAAAVSSACCWLPLLLLAFGLSAGGVAGFFEAVRPYFLVAAAVFLGAGFYFAYFPGFLKSTCKPGEACALPNYKLQRFNRAMLWVAAGVVAAFALFPYYSPAVVRAWGGATTADDPERIQDQSGTPIQTVSQTYAIDGMTCRGCAATLELELTKLPGVVEVSVSYEQGAATLRAYRDALEREAVRVVVEQAGFHLSDGTDLESER